MPVLPHPEKELTVCLPERSAKVIAETDVLVVGGGLAGLGAAIGSAQAGASTIVVEEYGFLGGHATVALINAFVSFYTSAAITKPVHELNFFPRDHGPGEPVIAGVLAKFIRRLVERGGALPPSQQTGFVVPFDPEIFKNVAEELLNEAGVKFLYHSLASGIIGENRPEGVILETKSGPLVIKAKIFIDCTGDGDIAAMAGAPFELGREEDGLTQPMTLIFRIGEFNRTRFESYVKEHPTEWFGVQGLRQLVHKAAQEGKLHLPRENILFFGTPHEKEINVNSTRIIKVLGTDVWDLTYAEYMGRQQMKEIAAFLKEYVPGFEDSYVIQSGTKVGVRETRRILGAYKLTEEDIVQARKFADVIARGTYPVDIHSPSGKGTVFKRLPPGESYDIPLRCLIPQKVDNLLVAGRCISGTHEAQAAYRVMAISMATGQAAGVCAALSTRNNIIPRQIAYQEVQEELRMQGALLPGK